MPAAPRTLSDQLRDFIADSGLSVRELGKRADVDDGIIHRFLSGERGMTTPTLDKIGQALGLKLVESSRPARPRRPVPAGAKRGRHAEASSRD